MLIGIRANLSFFERIFCHKIASKAIRGRDGFYRFSDIAGTIFDWLIVCETFYEGDPMEETPPGPD